MTTATTTITATALRLRGWWRRCRRGVARPERAPAAPIDTAERLLGPGWFDSSWDLYCGLDVCEGLPANASVNEWLLTALAPQVRRPT